MRRMTAVAGGVLVLGSTGPTGRLVVEQAVRHGHTVTAVSRHGDRLGFNNPRLTVAAADVAGDPSMLDRLMPGHDVVISVLGVGKGLRSHGLIAQATPNILAAMSRHAVRRLIFVSAFGVGGTAPHAPLFFRLMFRVMLGDIYGDKAIGEDLIRRSGLDWTILAPLMLRDAPGRGVFHLLEDEPRQGPWRLARADLAGAILRCVDDEGTVEKRLVVQ